MDRRSFIGGLSAIVGLVGLKSSPPKRTILTVDNSWPCIIYDANGKEVRFCISACVETGEVERFVVETDFKGDHWEVYESKYGEIEVKTEKLVVPAPLRVQYLYGMNDPAGFRLALDADAEGKPILNSAGQSFGQPIEFDFTTLEAS